jgi:hypothetical protein
VPISLRDIPSNLASLSVEQMSQLARVQMRSLSTDGGLDLVAMSDTAIPAFYAAHLRHFQQLLQEGEHGPYLPPLNASSSLFSASFHQAQQALMTRAAVPVRAEQDIHQPLRLPDMVIPHLNLFQETDVISAVVGVKSIMVKVTNQKYLTNWYRTTSPTRQELIRLHAAYQSLDMRLQHLSPVEYTGSHKPFDLNPKLTIRHQPNAFLKTFLPVQDEGMSQHQMSLNLKLLLGLPIPALLDSDNVCPCGQNHDFHGYHRLICKQNAGRAN